jgi:hypothetical protein
MCTYRPFPVDQSSRAALTPTDKPRDIHTLCASDVTCLSWRQSTQPVSAMLTPLPFFNQFVMTGTAERRLRRMMGRHGSPLCPFRASRRRDVLRRRMPVTRGIKDTHHDYRNGQIL